MANKDKNPVIMKRFWNTVTWPVYPAHDLIDMVTKEWNVPQNYGYPPIRR